MNAAFMEYQICNTNIQLTRISMPIIIIIFIIIWSSHRGVTWKCIKPLWAYKLAVGWDAIIYINSITIIINMLMPVQQNSFWHPRVLIGTHWTPILTITEHNSTKDAAKVDNHEISRRQNSNRIIYWRLFLLCYVYYISSERTIYCAAAALVCYYFSVHLPK
jgi:hypothetical protein